MRKAFSSKPIVGCILTSAVSTKFIWELLVNFLFYYYYYYSFLLDSFINWSEVETSEKSSNYYLSLICVKSISTINCKSTPNCMYFASFPWMVIGDSKIPYNSKFSFNIAPPSLP